MPSRIPNQDIVLSRVFQDKAAEAEALSYRRVALTIVHHAPGHPQILQETAQRHYDRLEIGLHDLVILRAALEYPQMAFNLIAFLNPLPSAQPVPGSLNAIKEKVREQFNLQAKPGLLSSAESRKLLRRTESELDRRLDFLRNFPAELVFSFAGHSDHDNVARLTTAENFRYLPLTRRFLRDWLVAPAANDAPKQAEAPLDSVRATVVPVLGRLDEARSLVAENLNPGRKIITIEAQKVTLALA